MSDIDQKNLESMIRKILTEIIAEKDGGRTKVTDKSGIMSFHTPNWKPEPFDTGKAGDKVYLKDMVT
ncbi:MAG: ethanolamine utilization protein, partial [Candidatus Adiutrix sp.]|nr:ethanolamine utilization protein [Candidatus Adiutrix sp.]